MYTPLMIFPPLVMLRVLYYLLMAAGSKESVTFANWHDKGGGLVPHCLNIMFAQWLLCLLWLLCGRAAAPAPRTVKAKRKGSKRAERLAAKKRAAESFHGSAGGSPGFKMQTFAESGFEFKVLADACAFFQMHLG